VRHSADGFPPFAEPRLRLMNILPPPEQTPQPETELSEIEAAEIEERLRALGYID
jgi:hypothetical protein